MNIHSLTIPLNTSDEQVGRLESLQSVFADICNALAPVVRETKCWNRVALHHMMYRVLRDQFPQVGSQMVCNAIYSVSRTSRVVFQSPQSPFNIQRLVDKPLPLLKFLASSPVYFDRHTLSIKPGSLSMYTLDGRMRFDLSLSDEDFNRFKTWKLHEVILSSVGSKFTLNFSFVDGKLAKGQELNIEDGSANVLPEYVIVDERALLPAGDVLATLPAPDQALLQTTTIVQPVVANELHLELNVSRGFAQSVKTMPQGMSLNISTTQLNLNIQHNPNPNGQPKGLGVAQANNNKSGANS